MTEERLKEIEDRANAATEGEWVFDEPTNWFGLHGRVFVADPYGLIATVEIESWRPKAKARATGAFIAHSRTDIPDLCAALREARERIKELEGK